MVVTEGGDGTVGGDQRGQPSLRSSFVWLLAIVCLHISCWAATPYGMLAKPRRRVQPMQTTGEK